MCSVKVLLILTKKECIESIIKESIIITDLLYKKKVIVPFMKTYRKCKYYLTFIYIYNTYTSFRLNLTDSIYFYLKMYVSVKCFESLKAFEIVFKIFKGQAISREILCLSV